MIYAPVIIPTLNRDEHLIRCIESLKNNSYAKYTELYVGLDYPPSAKYEEGYNKINDYLKNGVDGFKAVYIIRRPINMGPIMNGRTLIDEILAKYDRYIFTEDDNEFSPCFLEYADTALEKYENDESIMGICASSTPPLDYDGVSELIKTNYFSAHGYATWRDKENEFFNTMCREYIEDICCSKSKMFNLRYKDPRTISLLASALLRKEKIYQTKDGSIPILDTVRMIYACAEDKYILASVTPMVRNWGYDGSGANCIKENNDYSKRNILLDDKYDIYEKKVCECRVNPAMSIKKRILRLSAELRIAIWRIISKHRMHE